MKVLCGATQGNLTADETRQKMAVLAENLQCHSQHAFQSQADYELVHQHKQELLNLIPRR